MPKVPKRRTHYFSVKPEGVLGGICPFILLEQFQSSVRLNVSLSVTFRVEFVMKKCNNIKFSQGVSNCTYQCYSNMPHTVSNCTYQCYSNMPHTVSNCTYQYYSNMPHTVSNCTYQCYSNMPHTVSNCTYQCYSNMPHTHSSITRAI